MRETIINLLKPFANVCYKLVSAVPLDAVAFIYVLVLAILALWVLTLRREKPAQAAAGAGLLHDLRLWALLIISIQAIIYVLLR